MISYMFGLLSAALYYEIRERSWKIKRWYKFDFQKIKRDFTSPEFYKRNTLFYADDKRISEFEIFLYKAFICGFIGHKWEWWQLIERHKCARCLEPMYEDNCAPSRFGFLRKLNEYRRLQIPFWKLAGQKLSKDEQQYEKWMHWKGYDYYDVQMIRDRHEGAYYKKDLNVLKNPPKPVKVEYSKVSIPIEQ